MVNVKKSSKILKINIGNKGELFEIINQKLIDEVYNG